MKSSSTLASRIVIYLGSDLLGKSLPFLLLPLLTRVLTVEEFGVLATLMVLIGLLTVAQGLSIPAYIRTQFFDGASTHSLNGSWTVSLIALAAISSLFALAIFIYFYLFGYGGPDSSHIVLYVLCPFVAFFSIIFQTVQTIINSRGYVVRFALVSISFAALNFLVTILLIYLMEDNLVGRFIAILLSSVLVCASYKRVFEFSWPERGMAEFKDMLLFGVPLIPHQITGWVRLSSDRIMVGMILGVTATGYYSAAVQFASIMLVINTTLNNAMSPMILSLVATNASISNKRRLNRRLSLIVVSFALLISVFVALSFEYVMAKSYADYKWLSCAMVFVYAFNGLYFIYSHYLIQAKLGGELSKITVASALVHVVLMLPLMFVIGLWAVVVASAASYLYAFLATKYKCETFKLC